MTKQDYIALASAIADAREGVKAVGIEPAKAQFAHDIYVASIAATLYANNPRFNHSRFVHACNGGNT
jgi:hypothetical protein